MDGWIYLFIHNLNRIDINNDIELLNLKPKDETRVRSANIRGNEYKIMIIKIN